MTHTEFDNYQLQAMRTAKQLSFNEDLMHVGLGLAGEAGELADAVKKHLVYGRELDRGNVIEELGDLLWFVALGCCVMGVAMADVAQLNVDKLRKRYPDKYTDHHAQARLDKHGEEATA